MLRDMLFKRSETTAVRDLAQVDPTAPLLSMRGVEKSFPQGGGQIFVLRRIAVDIKPGEFVSIMGPSGAGKSTLLHIMGMHDHAWSGEYQLLGQPIHQLAAKDRATLQKKTIGFVFQAYHLLDDLTVYENIELPLSYRDVPRSERQASSPTCSIASASSPRRISIRINCQADSSSWSASRARWWRIRQ